ncbi:MAG TPA: TonB family protein [Gemmatimonadaceae bacterium]|jgi:protein TonB|nr:TonB family protein [Gemmatimonadaceae bacterium]
MFNNLLESKPKKEKRGGGTVTSVVVHSILVGLAVYATANAAIRNEKPKQEKIDFVETPKDQPPPKEEPPPPPPPDVVVAPPPPKGFQVLTAPVEIPDVIPDIDLSKKVTDESDFSGKGVAGGTSKGVEGGKAVVQSDQPYFEFQVEKPVVPAPGSISPRYPDMLRQAGVEGEVLAQFVVDTTGKAEPGSLKILKSSHDMFIQSVKNALPQMKFIPAEVGGKKVKQLVQQPFTFSISK